MEDDYRGAPPPENPSGPADRQADSGSADTGPSEAGPSDTGSDDGGPNERPVPGGSGPTSADDFAGKRDDFSHRGRSRSFGIRVGDDDRPRWLSPSRLVLSKLLDP